MRIHWLQKPPRELLVDGTEQLFFANRQGKGYLRTDLDSALKKLFVDQPDGLFDLPLKDIKNEKRSRVSQLDWHGKKYILKRYNLKTPFHRLRWWYRSMAEKIWRKNLLFTAKELPTPLLLGVADIGNGRTYQGTVALYEWIKGAAESKTILKEEYLETDKRKIALHMLATFLFQMHQRGVYHGDAKISNVLWICESERPEIIVIDLDSVRFVKELTDKQRLHDLKNLAASLAWWETDACIVEDFFNQYLQHYQPWSQQPKYWLKRLQGEVDKQIHHRGKRQNNHKINSQCEES